MMTTIYGFTPDEIDRLSLPRFFMYAFGDAAPTSGPRLLKMTLKEALAYRASKRKERGET